MSENQVVDMCIAHARLLKHGALAPIRESLDKIKEATGEERVNEFVVDKLAAEVERLRELAIDCKAFVVLWADSYRRDHHLCQNHPTHQGILDRIAELERSGDE